MRIASALIPGQVPGHERDGVWGRLGPRRTAFSFEFFPPKDHEGKERLIETIFELKKFHPAYVSVTYGAGGSTRDLTVELVSRIKNEIGIEAMAHLTCVGATAEEIHLVLEALRAQGIENILALRGDPPKGESKFRPTAGGYGSAAELISAIQKNFGFCLGAAAYPEVHPEAESAEVDLEYLVQKVRAGAEFLVTQLFFDNVDYFRFVDQLRSRGVDVPVVAGIMPVTNYEQAQRFTRMCGAKIPAGLAACLEKVKEDPQAVRAVGVEHATQQCAELVAAGVPGIHFYTLNRSLATRQVLESLHSQAR